jgi:hypothetical protein
MGAPRRAPRFSLTRPVRYRSVGALGWSVGTTENISCSGLLFHPAAVLPIGTPLEMVFALAPGAPEIVCRGRVVRASTDGPGEPALGATITGYRFVREAAA